MLKEEKELWYEVIIAYFYNTLRLTLQRIFYRHLDYNSKINSAETFSRVLGGTEVEESNSSEFADK